MIPALYILLALISWPILSAVILHHFQSEYPGTSLDTTEVVAAVAIGFFSAPLWPITLLIALGSYAALRILHAIQDLQPTSETDSIYQHPSKR